MLCSYFRNKISSFVFLFELRSCDRQTEKEEEIERVRAREQGEGQAGKSGAPGAPRGDKRWQSSRGRRREQHCG